MVTENNSQINSFYSGMDSDSSYSNIKDGGYIYAENIRVLSYGNNNQNYKGSIKPINGVTQLNSIINDNVERILATGSIRNYGVIIYISGTKDYQLCVSVFTNKIGNGNDSKQSATQLTDLHTIFRSDLINWPSKDKWPSRISIQFKYESEDNIKLYVATGFNPIFVLNITQDYGDIDMDQVSSYPKVIFEKPKFQKYISGKLKPALVKYSYQLYNKHGISTDISPACQNIPIINFQDQSKTDILQIDGQQFDVYTNCGIQIKIKGYPLNGLLNKIKVYRITIQKNGQQPTIEIIYDSDYNLVNNYFTLDDVGQDPIDTISIEEYNSMSGVHIIPKAIESKDDILFAANVKTVQTLIDDEEFKNWDARSFRADKNGIIKIYPNNQFYWSQLKQLSTSKDLYCLQSYNEYNNINETYPIDNYCVYDKNGYYGGSGVNVDWRFVISNSCIDSSSVYGGKEIGTLSNKINCQRPRQWNNCCYFIHKTNGLVQSDIFPSDEEGRINNDWLIKSLRRDELYRYGIILYDKSGYASPVKWIADIRTPSLCDKYFHTFISHYKVDTTGDIYDLAGRQLGVAFNVKNFPKGCTGYEIVRCKRSFQDIATVSQGVISKPITEYRCPATQRAKSNIYFPTGLLTTATVVQGSDFKYFTQNYNPTGKNGDAFQIAAQVCQSNIENNNVYQFVSPEVCYQPEYMKTVFKNKDFRLQYLRYVFGCSAQSKTKNRFDMAKAASNSETFRDFYTANVDGGTRYFLQTAISNANYFLQDNKNWKYIDSNDIDQNFVTQKYWLKMPVWMIKSIYYKAFPEDKKWTARKAGSYNSMKYDVSDTKMNGIDTDVFSYIKLYEQGDDILYRQFNGKDDSHTYNHKINLQSSKISDLSIAYDLQWNEIVKMTFEEKGTNSETKDNGRWWPQLEYLNHIDSIGQKQYCNAVFYGMDGIRVDKGGEPGDDNWTIIKDMIEGVNDQDEAFKDFELNSQTHVGRIPYSSGGRCAILQLDDSDTEDLGFEIGAKTVYVNEDNQLVSKDKSNYNGVYINSIPGTSICNIRKTATPYGGNSLNAIQSSVYYSNGQYFPAKSRWNAVFDGDVYISVLDYTAMHKSITNYTKSKDSEKNRNINDYRSPSMMLGYAIPLESTINCRLSYGYEFSKNSISSGASMIQVQPSNIEGVYSQADPEYVYNSAYSSDDQTRVHASYDYSNEEDFNKQIDNRCYNSLLKESGENIDQWTKFQSSNFIDVDSRYGEITGLSYYNNMLVFWQQNATGILSVNDRAIVNDQNGTELILGSGGVLTRYDYIDDTSGMHKNQFCFTKSQHSLYWFDDHNDELKMLQDRSIVSISKQCNIQNLLYSKRSDNSSPFVVYDQKNNEIIFRVLKGLQSVSYSETGGCFQSVYTIPFNSCIQFNNGIYMTEVENGRINIGQWDYYNKYTNTWGKRYANAYIEYVVNKNPLFAKVFDNQEIVTPQDEIGLLKSNYFDDQYHTYSWKTDFIKTNSNLIGQITNREHNYRYSIPRANSNNFEYGGRIRGKYMICSINNTKPSTDIAVQYIITKFRTSCS